MKKPFLVIFLSDSNIFCFEENKELKTSFKSELPKWKRAIIIDSEQKVYHIKEAVKVGWGNWFFGINFFYKERLLKIDFVIEKVVEISFQELQNILIGKVEHGKPGKYMIRYHGSIKKLVEKIGAKKTVKEIMELFLYDD